MFKWSEITGNGIWLPKLVTKSHGKNLKLNVLNLETKQVVLIVRQKNILEHVSSEEHLESYILVCAVSLKGVEVMRWLDQVKFGPISSLLALKFVTESFSCFTWGLEKNQDS